MTGARRTDEHQPALHADLVEYFVVVAPDRDGLVSVAAAVAELVRESSLRVLDVVALVRSPSGELNVWDVDPFPELVELASPTPAATAAMLSENDIELSSLAVPPGAAGVVVLAENRYAESLSVAARSVGGQIAAGDRIPPPRVEALLSRLDSLGAGTIRSSGRRRSVPDLLERAPSGVVESERAAWAALVIDPVAQLAELDDLFSRGLISRDEFAQLKSRIVPPDGALSWTTSDEPAPQPPSET